MTDSLIAFLKQCLSILQWWVSVSPWEQGLRVRLGKHVRVLTPGVSLRIPFVDVVFVQSVRMRVATMPTQTVTLKNGKPLTIGSTIGYSIDSIATLYETLDHAEDTLVNKAAVALAEAALETDRPEPISLAAAAQSKLDYTKYGIGQLEIRVTDLVQARPLRLLMDQRWSTSKAIDMTIAKS